jgi:hypothetical protein
MVLAHNAASVEARAEPAVATNEVPEEVAAAPPDSAPTIEARPHMLRVASDWVATALIVAFLRRVVRRPSSSPGRTKD